MFKKEELKKLKKEELINGILDLENELKELDNKIQELMTLNFSDPVK